MSGSLVLSPNLNKLYVLDSWPVMEWLKAREPNATRFDLLLAEARAGHLILLISTINLGEIYYNSWTTWGEARAEEVYFDFKKLPVHVIHPTEEDALLAARIKGRYKVAYGDAFAAVLALEFDATVLSGDPDFRKLEQLGVLAIEWLGK